MSKQRRTLLQAATRLLGGGGFSYDPDKDEDYRQYEKTYTRLGKRAMEDTVGTVSGRTGGLASSYAQTAGQQAYGNYMAQLADKVPQLRQAAYQRYADQRRQDMDSLELLQRLEQEDYQRQRDKEQDTYQRQRDAHRDAQDQRDYNYKVQRDEAQAEADRQQAADKAEADTKVQLRKDLAAYLEQGGTLEGLYKTFGEQAVADSGYLPGQLEQMEAWYKQKNEPKPTATASSGSGKKEEQPKPTDWTETRQWFDTYGEEGMEDWFKANYKDLGFSTAAMAQSAWNNHVREQQWLAEEGKRQEEQAQRDRENRLAQAAKGNVLNGENKPVDPVIVDAFNDLLEGGMDLDDVRRVVDEWVKKGWYGLDEEGKLSLMATVG